PVSVASGERRIGQCRRLSKRDPFTNSARAAAPPDVLISIMPRRQTRKIATAARPEAGFKVRRRSGSRHEGAQRNKKADAERQQRPADHNRNLQPTRTRAPGG